MSVLKAIGASIGGIVMAIIVILINLGFLAAAIYIIFYIAQHFQVI